MEGTCLCRQGGLKIQYIVCDEKRVEGYGPETLPFLFMVKKKNIITGKEAGRSVMKSSYKPLKSVFLVFVFWKVFYFTLQPLAGLGCYGVAARAGVHAVPNPAKIFQVWKLVLLTQQRQQTRTSNTRVFRGRDVYSVRQDLVPTSLWLLASTSCSVAPDSQWLGRGRGTIFCFCCLLQGEDSVRKGSVEFWGCSWRLHIPDLLLVTLHHPGAPP